MSIATDTGGNPATVSGGDGGATTSAPTTFAEAFAANASPASDTPDSSHDAAAAVQPTTDQGSPQQTDDRSPFIPRARFDEVNTKKGELESRLQSLAWAEQVNPTEFQQIQRIAKAFSGGDFMAGLNELITEGRRDPAVEAQIRSFAARTLASRSQQQPEQEPQPDLPIQLEDGRVVHLFSAEQQAKREAWLQKQWLAGVDQRLQPLQQTHEQLQAQRAAVEQQQRVTHFTTSTFNDMVSWPGMASKDNQVAVAKALAAMNLPDDASPEQVQLAANAAYRQAVLPTLSKKAESSLLDNLQKQAAASTGINPGSAAATTPRRIDKFSQLGPEAWR